MCDRVGASPAYTCRFFVTVRFSRGGGCGGCGVGVLAPPSVGVQSPRTVRSVLLVACGVLAPPSVGVQSPHPNRSHHRVVLVTSLFLKNLPVQAGLAPALWVEWQGFCIESESGTVDER
jgi:hypothetical protein